MPIFRSEPDAAHVVQISFNETHQAEIRFSDGREVVWTGSLAAELRMAVQAAITHGFARKRRGMSGPNSAAN
jgi:hypothetical protein